VTGAGPAVGTASGKRRGEERAFHAVA
jgi:hypothetical protein